MRGHRCGDVTRRHRAECQRPIAQPAPPCAAIGSARTRRRPPALAFHGSETRIACPASAPRPIAASTWLAATLPELHAAPALTAMPVQIERDHLRVRPHARAAPGRWCWPAAPRRAPHTTAPARHRRPSRPRPAAAPASDGIAGRRGRRRKSGDGRQRRRAAAPAALLPAAGDQRRRWRRPRAPAAGRRRPAGPPSLCEEIARLWAPSAARVDRDAARPPAPHRHAAARHGGGTARRPRRPAGTCRSRCWPASGRPGPAARPPAARPARRGRRRRRDRPAASPLRAPRRAPRHARWRR